jgi:Tfp pilus assembly protein PilF
MHEDSDLPAARLNRRVWLICLALFLFTFAAFAAVARNDFVAYDDPFWVTHNPHVQKGLAPESIAWALTTSEIGYWHPLTWLSHLVDVELFGLRPAPQHLVNVVIHSFSAAILFLALLLMTGATWRSAFAAAVFAIHPLRVESVAWISERKDVLYMLFGVLTLLAYQSAIHRQARQIVLVSCCYALSLMAKPMLVTLPFLLLLLDVWPLRRIELIPLRLPRRVLIEKIPLFALALIFCCITYAAQRRADTMVESEYFPLGARLMAAPVNIVRYLGKWIWPTRLAVLYPLDVHVSPWQSLLAGGLVIGISAAALVMLRRHSYLAVGWFWFLGTLVPVIGIVQVGLQATADRYSYFPTIGLGICLAWGIGDLTQRLPRRGRLLWPVGIVALVSLACVSQVQIGYWRNTMTLFNRALAVTNNNYVAHSYIGSELAQRGDFTDAEQEFREAIRIRPDYAQGYFNLGNCLAEQNRVLPAIQAYHRAIDLRPRFAEALLNLGRLYAGVGQMDSAAANFARATMARPDYVEAHVSFGQALQAMGDADGAIAQFRAALALRPDQPAVRQRLLLAERQKQPPATSPSR